MGFTFLALGFRHPSRLKPISYLHKACTDPVWSHTSGGCMRLVYWSDFYDVLHYLNHTVWTMVWPCQICMPCQSWQACRQLHAHLPQAQLNGQKHLTAASAVPGLLNGISCTLEACDILFVISATICKAKLGGEHKLVSRHCISLLASLNNR